MCLACEVAEKGVGIIEERVAEKYAASAPTYNSAANSNY